MRACSDSVSPDPGAPLPTAAWLLSHAVIAIDVDDTLVNTFGRAYRKTARAAVDLGCEPPTREAFMDGYELGDLQAAFSRWFPQIPPAETERAYDALQPDFPDEPLVDFPVLRRRLSSGGARVGILSNSQSARLRRKLGCLGGAEPLAFVLGRDDLPAPKPSPEAFAPLLKAFACRPSDVLYVGDSPTDLAAARAAGVSFLLVRTGPRPWAPPPEVPAVTDMAALLEVLGEEAHGGRAG